MKCSHNVLLNNRLMSNFRPRYVVFSHRVSIRQAKALPRFQLLPRIFAIIKVKH